MTSRLLRTFIVALSILVSSAAFAADDAGPDKYIGYRWQPTLLSSYRLGEAPEIRANLDALTSIVAAEKAEGKGRFLPDIINGFWFYASAHAWSTPAETDGKLPPREGQTPTATSLETADILIDAWKAFSDKIEPSLPILGTTLDATMKRVTGKNLK